MLKKFNGHCWSSVIMLLVLSSSLNAMDMAIFLGEYTPKEDAVIYYLNCAVEQRVPIIASSALIKSLIDIADMPFDSAANDIVQIETAERQKHLEEVRKSEELIKNLNDPNHEINIINENKYLRNIIKAHNEIANDEKNIEVFTEISRNLQNLRKNLVNKLKDDALWRISMGQSKDLTVLIPVGYKNTANQDTTFLKQIQNNLLDAMLEQTNYAISPDNIISCINAIRGNNHPRILLCGHGNIGSIAGLDMDNYQKLLRGLIQMLCDLLYISSCYAGGINQITMHQDQSTLSKFEIPFPTILGSVTDAPSTTDAPSDLTSLQQPNFYRKNSRLDNFFKTVDEFYSNPGTNRFGMKGKKSIGNVVKMSAWTKEPFKKMCGELFLNKPLQNAPLIRLPGLETVFTALDIDNQVLCLTYPTLLKTELQLRANKVTRAIDQHKQPIDKKYVIDITGKEAALLYPSVLQIPLRCNGSSVPKLISMIPGFGRHYIDSIITPNCSLDKLLLTMFIQNYNSKGLNLRADKNYYIRELYCKNYANSNILHPGSNLDNENENLLLSNVKIRSSIENNTLWILIAFDCNGISFECNKKVPAHDEINVEFQVDSYRVGKILEETLIDTKPDPSALFEATGGIESDRQFEDLVKGITMKQKISKFKTTRAKKLPTVETPELKDAPLIIQEGKPIEAEATEIQ